MAIPKFDFTSKEENLPVTGRNQPKVDFTRAAGGFGGRPYNVIPAPRVTIDQDNINTIKEGISPELTESIDGISDQKPHILLVSDFKPLFITPSQETPAKKYFDTILETRRLKAENLFLEYDSVAGSSLEIKGKFEKIFKQNSSLVSFLRSKFESIIGIHSDVEKFKMFLDPRGRRISLDDEMIRNFPKLGTREVLEENLGGDSVIIEAKELLEEIGFSTHNFQYYSNTKVLAQIIQGYRMLCKNKDLNFRSANADINGGLIPEHGTPEPGSRSRSEIVDFNNLPKNRQEVFSFCFGRSSYDFWSRPWDSGSIQLFSSLNERLFSDGTVNVGNINYDKMADVINLLSTEFSVCFNRTLQKNSPSYTRENFSFSFNNRVLFPTNLLTNQAAVDSLSIYSVLKTSYQGSGSLVFEPQNLDICKNLLDTSSFDSIKPSIDKIKSTIDTFENDFLSLSKNFGFVPVSTRGDSFSQLFSSKTLFENIYYRFFDLNGKAKWDLNEITSHVFSIIHNATSELGEYIPRNNQNFQRGGYAGSSNTIKYSLFLILCSEIGTESTGGRKSRIGIFWENLKSFFIGHGSGSDVSVSKDGLIGAFEKTPELRRFLDYRNNPSTEGESLYKIISSTLKEFNYVIENFCLDEETGRTNHRGFDRFFILLMVFEIILMVILGGYKSYVSGMNTGFTYFSLEDQTIIFDRPSLEGNLQNRDNLIRKFFCFISGYMRQTKEEIENIQRKVANPSLQDFIKDIKPINPGISSKQQSSIALNSLLDLQPLFSDSEMRTGTNIPSYKFVNSSILGEKTKSAFFYLMKNNKFLSDGRIISVGIPNGFFDEILYKPKRTNSTWSYSQKDIVRLKIYKIELTRPDIVFIPVIKEFELSRLIARDDSYLIFDGRGSYDVSMGQFPTRDFDNLGDKSINQYFHPEPSRRSSINITGRGSFELFQALEGPSYDGVQNNSKINIYKNHVESYLLEIYTRIMSGISLAEGNVSDFSKITPGDLQSNLKNIISDPGIILEPFTTFDRVDANNPSTLSSTEQIALNVLAPKPYDRVLNILVRSDDFVIDFFETIADDSGFNSLESDPDIFKTTVNGPVEYRLKPREYSFETYFVTIETESGDVI